MGGGRFGGGVVLCGLQIPGVCISGTILRRKKYLSVTLKAARTRIKGSISDQGVIFRMCLEGKYHRSWYSAEVIIRCLMPFIERRKKRKEGKTKSKRASLSKKTCLSSIIFKYTH